jgi:putative membrane protein
VLASLATLAPAFHGAVFWPFFIIGPIFWFVILILIVVLVATGRRRRMARWAAWGHGGFGPWGGGGRGAESTLAERFANGDIDEKEYRARLEVLRANNGFQHPAAK